MTDKTEALAITLQVNRKDLECLINVVFNTMTDDNLRDYYIEASEAERVELIQAYVADARQRFQSFSESYQLSEMKKKSFNNTIYLMAMGANV